MATASKTKVNPNLPAGLPAEWADAELLEGAELLEKSELIGRPFLITALKQSVSTGAEQYAMVWVEAEFVDGETFTFSDSSAKNGVRVDAAEILTSKGKGDLLDEWVPVRVVCPKGLRVSKYEKEDPITRRMRPSQTYYLTRSGQRSTTN